jgi:hypothetical protein
MNTIQYYQSPFQKIRIGNQSTDGGYVICKIPNLKYSLLLSGGIADDLSFEEEFIDLYGPNLEAHGFDPTIEHLPKEYEDLNLTYHSKYIGEKDTDEYTTLKPFLHDKEGIFVKMDIEGSEYAWISALSDEELLKIDQMVIEFHYPWYSLDTLQIIDRLYKFFYLFHFHPNNCAPPEVVSDQIKVSHVFECTFVSKRHCEGLVLEKNKDPVPCPLDRPNVLFNPTESFEGPPYTF